MACVGGMKWVVCAVGRLVGRVIGMLLAAVARWAVDGWKWLVAGVCLVSSGFAVEFHSLEISLLKKLHHDFEDVLYVCIYIQ